MTAPAGFGDAPPTTGAPAGFGDAPPSAPPGFTSAPPPVSGGGAPSGFGDAPPVTPPVQRILSAVQHGKPLGKALHGIPQLRGVQHVETDVRANLDWARHHPVDAFFQTLSAPQRAVAAWLTTGNENEVWGPGYAHAIGTAITHGDARSVAAQTTGVEQFFGMPTHAAIDQFVKTHVPAQLRPYASAVLTGGEDFAAQSATDPLSYVGVREITMPLQIAHHLFQAGHVAQGAHAAAQAVGLGRVFSHLASLGQTYRQGVQTVGEHLNTFFGVRPDLDAHFTQQGKQARIAIENSEYAKAARAMEHDVAAAAQGGPAAVQRYLQYIVDHGTAQTRAEAQSVAHQMGVLVQATHAAPSRILALGRGTASRVAQQITTDAIDAADALTRTRNAVRSGMIARRTEAYVQHFGGNNPNAAPLDFTRIATEDPRGVALRQALDKIGLGGVAAFSRGLQRAAVFVNPFPHGVKNVGQLAYLAGGARVVPEAFAHMFAGAGRGVAGFVQASGNLGDRLHAMGENMSALSAADKARLEQIGAAPTYTHGLHGPGHGTLWDNVPGYRQFTGGMQNVMQTMEEGWRKALLDQLDRQMGPSRNAQDELRKGYEVAKRIGDYRNQNGFVKLFEAIGGPFVAFRLGIVPQNIVKALHDNPGRVLALLRAPQDLQANRTQQAQAANRLEVGGPTDDFAKMVFAPGNYLTSPSSLGMVGSAIQSQFHPQGEPLSQDIASAARYNVPGASEAEDLANTWWLGDSMPGQQMSLADKLTATTLHQLGMYFLAQKNKKQRDAEKAEYKRIRKEGP